MSGQLVTHLQGIKLTASYHLTVIDDILGVLFSLVSSVLLYYIRHCQL